MINQKITFPRDDNFSDDELSFLPYFIFFNAIKVCIVLLQVKQKISITHEL